MLAFHTNKLLSLRGAAEQPSGGWDCISFISLMRRVMAAREGPDADELDPEADSDLVSAVEEEDDVAISSRTKRFKIQSK